MNELDALWAFLVAAVIALLATPFAARIAHRVGAVDAPRDRGLHDRPMPYLGGLAILVHLAEGRALAEHLEIGLELRDVLQHVPVLLGGHQPAGQA